MKKLQDAAHFIFQMINRLQSLICPMKDQGITCNKNHSNFYGLEYIYIRFHIYLINADNESKYIHVYYISI